MLNNTPAIMLQGTSSNAGKSLLCTALCRIFTRRGLKVFPFKAQNMTSHLSFYNGKHMGGAQIMQAIAARQIPHPKMNPILLCAKQNGQSDIYLLGEKIGSLSYLEYTKKKSSFFRIVEKAYQELAKEADLMIIEGAGSPAEINLQAHDIVNMRIARMSEAKVWLVGDIDRGGVFAHLYGTYALLSAQNKRRIQGFILNKFRGDARLLKPAEERISKKTHIPFLATVPYIKNHKLPEEDSLSLAISQSKHLLPSYIAEKKIPPPVYKKDLTTNETQEKDFLPLGNFEKDHTGGVAEKKMNVTQQDILPNRSFEDVCEEYEQDLEYIANSVEASFCPEFLDLLEKTLRAPQNKTHTG